MRRGSLAEDKANETGEKENRIGWRPGKRVGEGKEQREEQRIRERSQKIKRGAVGRVPEGWGTEKERW